MGPDLEQGDRVLRIAETEEVVIPIGSIGTFVRYTVNGGTRYALCNWRQPENPSLSCNYYVPTRDIMKLEDTEKEPLVDGSLLELFEKEEAPARCGAGTPPA